MKFVRLPTNILPNHYDIFLTLNLEKFTYSGKQNVYINVMEPLKIVILNSIDIDIKNVCYINKSRNNTIKVENIQYNPSQEKVSLYFEKEIPEGKDGYLIFEFAGKINNKLNGLYRSKYLSEEGEKYAAVTQFAPIDARRCFPCWDEPAIKSTFCINLTIPQTLTAISNMPIKTISKVNESDLMSVSFEKTPVMSTYLVAFIVCDYDFIKQKNNSKVRVYAPKDKVEQGKFSLDVAIKALDFYESYFNISYPLSKLDLITVADFSFGAMENWGLITYREVKLLVDPINSSTASKQKVALTVAHELAHQWFGNLVTMEWWTDLWLNEGYASFMEYLCIDDIYPDYNIWAQFLTNVFKSALELDGLANTHPIEVSIENPSEITEIFDLISYYKGASIIRMIYRYIGDDDFKKGMNLYLNRHAYSNVKTADLWDALGEASNKPIGKIMSTWTKLSGFPLITVNEKQSSDSNKRVFTFSQERFYINGSVDNSNDTWIIPIIISSTENSKKPIKKILLDKKVQVIEIEDVSKHSWVKVNAGVVGFYRTLYSSNLLESLIKAIQEQNLPTFDRLGLIDDLFATVRAGKSSTVEFLNILKVFQTETNYIVWSSIISNLRKLSNVLLDFEDIYNDLKKFGRTLLLNIFTKLGWTAKENETHLDTLLRNLVLSQLVDFEDETVIEEAQRRFDLHVKKQNILPADFRHFVYEAVLLTGNMDTFEKLLSLYRETDMQEEKARILSSLGATKDKNIIQRVLEFSTSEEVRTQDTWSAIYSVTMTSNGRLLAWQYFKSNWKMFVNRFESGVMLKNIVESVTKTVVSEEVMNDIKTFFEKNNVPGVERTIKQSIETIEMNLAWLNRDKEKIKEFLKSL